MQLINIQQEYKYYGLSDDHDSTTTNIKEYRMILRDYEYEQLANCWAGRLRVLGPYSGQWYWCVVEPRIEDWCFCSPACLSKSIKQVGDTDIDFFPSSVNYCPAFKASSPPIDTGDILVFDLDVACAPDRIGLIPPIDTAADVVETDTGIGTADF